MLIIEIAGGTGSGKTTVVRRIIEQLPQGEVTVLPQDSYYRDNADIPLEERQKINFDHPDSLEFELLVEHLKRLKQGKTIELPTYSYLTCTRGEKTISIHPTQVVIIEGILILGHKELRELMDLRIFVDADANDRLSRVISRDIIERGRDVSQVLDRYKETVKPSHLQFIEPTKRYANLIVPQGGNNKVAINLLKQYIEQNLNS
ncbi:uridine kinase [Saccharicrinis fermentans]|uniref:Uridine kinase n=1 Tax=Saccharicrinis fermentans DSM 9555 = JCM 21142 TaxID=869213 RepID=W7Y2J3_9BACT|nr:uridine kinase [Saccharicrinis fermentans]GAF01768.1 uridine kinase [Saccharicrinis fermentans DSM 9555 = JCM 21142]